MLREEMQAPLDVTVFDSEGKEVTLRSLLGTPAVVYFYPKDDTPGCTKEACSIRDIYGELERLGVRVVGISKDTAKSHQKFKQKYRLPFELWSDPEHCLMEAFGTWQKKKFMGREYMGTTRTSFFLDAEGKIRKVWENVAPDAHGEDIVEFASLFGK